MRDRIIGHRWAVASACAVLIACAPVFILLSNLYVLFTPQFIRFEYSRPGFPDSTIYNSAERLVVADATLHYLRSSEGSDFLAGLRSQGTIVYNPREVRHMVDVKAVLQTAFRVHALAGLLCAISLFLLWRSTSARRSAYHALIQGCTGFVGILAAVVLTAYLRFDVFFIAFHRVFFEGDSWLFSYTDTLIQLFPLPLWIEATWLFSSLAVAECLLVSVCCWLQLRQYRHVT